MEFSVLMSLYKNEKPEYLKEAIDSIIGQTLMPNEIVIVKDGELTIELENTLNEYSEQYQSIFKFVVLKKNVGLGLALREGVKACSNDIIARMDSDDIAHCERFRKQIDFMKSNPHITIVGTNVLDFDKTIKNVVSRRIFPESNNDIIKFSKRRCPFLHPSIVFKKQAVLEIGNYEHLLWFEDYYIFLKLLSRGYQGHNIQENLLYFRSNDNMFQRRGGINYLRQELRALTIFYKQGYYNFFYFITNLLVRSSVRVLGNKFRKIFYNKLLRS
ncbi:glycosyltransferase [Alkalihalobacterium sp. APHAB7]|uniref:glycosyltransferase n=1 Tax=Alkalihalobacterium sp. APHAB7 TaxID=3402081 RepID=UPI003AAEF3E2